MTQSNIIIWGVGTTRTMRVHWMAYELGLDYETRRIESRTGETREEDFSELNPKQKIPTLVHNDIVISESYAIIRYLNTLSPLPRDDFQTSIKGEVAFYEWLSFILMELDATSLYVVRRHKDLTDIYGEAPAAVSSSIAYFERMIESVQKKIKAGDFLWGTLFSELDILMTIALDWATFLGVELPDNVLSYQQSMQQRDAYQSARLHNFRDLKIPTAPPR